MFEHFILRAYYWIHDVVFRAGRRRKRIRPPTPIPPEDGNGAAAFCHTRKRLRYNVHTHNCNALGATGGPSNRTYTRQLNRRELEYEERLMSQLDPALWVSQLRVHQLPTAEEQVERMTRIAAEQAKKSEKKRNLITDEEFQRFKERVEAKKRAEADKRTARWIDPTAESSADAERRSAATGLDKKLQIADSFSAALNAAMRETTVQEGSLAEGPSVPEILSPPMPTPESSNMSEAPMMPLYSYKCSLEPPMYTPAPRTFTEMELSPITLLAISKYLDENLKVSIQAEDEDVEMVPEIRGVPAFHSEMITAEDRVQYDNIRKPAESGINISIDNCDFTPRDIGTLLPGEWLNDNVVNGYMKLLQLRDSKGEGGPSCHFCKTFLTSKIFPVYNYAQVRKWTTPRRLENWGQSKKSILDCDLIFFPVHKNETHWVLVVADLPQKTILYYDSLGNSIPDKCPKTHHLMECIARYLVDEAKDKQQLDWNLEDLSYEIVRAMPQQRNSSDCGVYVVRTAKEVSGQNNDLSFTPEEMLQYRILILKELASGQLL